MSSADFYVGLGPHARWVTSVGAHADLRRLAELDLGRAVLHATTIGEYRSALWALGEYWQHTARGVVYLPNGAWPEATWLHPHLAGCRYVFDEEDASQPTVGRVWVAEPDEPSWRPAAPNTDQWDHPPQRHAVHPDTGRTVPIPCDSAATADYAYVRLLCDCVRNNLTPGMRRSGPGCVDESAHTPARDLLDIAADLVADAECYAARLDVRAAIGSARRARDAVRAAQRIALAVG